MNLKGLHLLVTYQCTYECDHCFVKSSPFAKGTMTLAQARDAINQAAQVRTITDICLEGGEPFLYYPVMLEIARFARELQFTVSIVTNGYFATTVADAMSWLRPLREICSGSVSISNDTFHSGDETRFSPANRALKAAEMLGLSSGTICIDPPSCKKGDQQPGKPILGGVVRFRGRAVEKLTDPALPVQPWDSYTSCPDEDWDAVGRLHLDPYGNLFSCQGVVFGNLNNNSLREIIDQYNPDTHPIIGPLKRGGPAELVREHNLDLHGAYHDACHLCFLARKELRSKYPEFLAPQQVYD